MKVGKSIVFDGKMGMRKFGSAAPPFSKVACAVKVIRFSYRGVTKHSVEVFKGRG